MARVRTDTVRSDVDAALTASKQSISQPGGNLGINQLDIKERPVEQRQDGYIQIDESRPSIPQQADRAQIEAGPIQTPQERPIQRIEEAERPAAQESQASQQASGLARPAQIGRDFTSGIMAQVERNASKERPPSEGPSEDQLDLNNYELSMPVIEPAPKMDTSNRTIMSAERLPYTDSETSAELISETTNADAYLDSVLESVKARPVEGAASSAEQGKAVVSQPAPKPQFVDAPSYRYRDAVKRQKNEAQLATQNKHWRGDAIHDKMIADPEIRPNEVSVGTEIIRSMIAEPRNKFIAMVSELSGIEMDPQTVDVENDLMPLINNMRIQVGTSKSPINRLSSAQRRTLRVHYGRGIKIHPTQSKSYNADFDGDEMNVTFDQRYVKSFDDAMKYLIDIDGSVTIDPDFFPHPLLRSDAETISYIEDYMLDWLPGDKSKISASLIEMTQNPGDNGAWQNLVMSMYDIAEPYGKNRYEVVSNILWSVFNGMRELNMLRTEFAMKYSDVSEYEVPTKTTLDTAIMDILSDYKAGAVPNNFQDFRIYMSRYLGEIPGNNVSFRLTADVAKIVKMNPNITIGTEEQWIDLYEHTMQAGYSMRMSSVTKLGDRQRYAAEMLRAIVLNRTGMPRDYAVRDQDGNIVGYDFLAFINSFVKNYVNMQNQINAADLTMLTDMSIRKNDYDLVRKISGRSMSDIVSQFISVYGEFTIDEIFGNQIRFGFYNAKRTEMWTEGNGTIRYIHAKYRNQTISQVAKQNSIRVTEKEAKDIGAKSYRDGYSIPNGGVNQSKLVSDLIMLIADKKTSKASKYNKTMIGDIDSRTGKPAPAKKGKDDSILANMKKTIDGINEQLTNKKTRDWSKWVDSMTELLYQTGPDMFYHFNMRSSEEFLDSKYGRALLNAKTKDQVGGIRIAMLVDYRLSKVKAARSEFREIRSDLMSDVDSIALTCNRYTMALDELASCSDAWEAIVREIRSVESSRAFNALKGKSNVTDVMKKLPGLARIHLPYYKDWSMIEHDSLLDFLLDTKANYTDKMNVLGDVARIHLQTPYINAYAMPYQLEMDPHSTFSSIGYDGDGSIFDTLDNANDEFNRYKKRSYKAAKKNIQEAYEEFGNEPGALESTLRLMVEDPSFLIEVDDQIYADAILTSMDKVFAQSEKGSQAPGPNALYQSLSLQKNGGFYSDVYRTDNRALGIIGKDQLSIIDCVKVLADPDYMLIIYDESGETSIVNRESLCGGRDESDVWRYLLEHPKVAMCVRTHRTNVIADNDAKTFLSATDSTVNTIGRAKMRNSALHRLAGRAKMEMRNHPKFGALVAMLSPIHMNVSRNLRSTIISNEKNLLKAITNLAVDRKSNDIECGTWMEKNLGITEDGIIAAGVDPDIAENLYSQIVDSLDRYSMRILEICDELGIEPKMQRIGEFPDYDLASIAMYYDVKQELSGAKTAISTGVEGQETFRMALWMGLLSPKDSYTDLGLYDDAELISLLNGSMTSLGIPISPETIDQLREVAATDDVVIEVPEDFVVQDKMLDRYGQQVSSVNRFLVIKRDDGAEKFNLKVKKLGDDGTDSVTKVDKYIDPELDNTVELRETLNDINAEQGLFAAKVYLAKYLKEQNEAIGYMDMDLANYVCLADLMIAYREETGIVLRSLEQISYAIKNRLSYDLIENGNPKDLKASAKEIADSVGFGVMTDPSSIFDGIKVNGTSEFSPIIRQRASSVHRNYDLLNQILQETGSTMHGDVEISQIKSDLREKHKVEANMIEGSNVLSNYDFLGIVGVDAFEQPGPQTVWVLNDATKDLSRARELGVTVIMRDPSMLKGKNEKYMKDLIQIPTEDNLFMLPFFDMRLNGMYCEGTEFGKSASFRADPSMAVVSFEDTTSEYALGDASVQFFDALIDRTNVNWSDTYEIPDSDLFADTYRKFMKDDVLFSVDIASREEIERFILQDREEYAIDYGASMSSSSFDEIRERTDRLIQEYVNNRSSMDENGFLPNAKPNQIVGWMRCDIIGKTGLTQHVFAPIIVWPTGGTSKAPSDFSIEGYSYDRASSKVKIDWKYNGDISKEYVKVHEGGSTANKFVGNIGDSIDGGTLKNGVPVDMAFAQESTTSRRLGTNKRILTMVTLMFMARRQPYGYNFAEHDRSFPDDPELKQRLASERISESEWKKMESDIASGAVRFHQDDMMNAFVTDQVIKCFDRGINPSDFLASRFDMKNSGWFYEFETLMETGYTYQNALMSYLNYMMPSLCPPSISGDWKRCLFKPNDGDGFDFGCLQMQVPHHSPITGGTYYNWENVYVNWSFFGQDFSGFSKPSVNGSSIMMEQLNAMVLSARQPRGMNFNNLVKWAASERIDPNLFGSAGFDIDRPASQGD